MLWSVKLQPMVLHIVPEALPKKKKKSSNVTRKPARQGEGRVGGQLAGAGQAGQERGPRSVHPLPGIWAPSVRPPRTHSEGKWAGCATQSVIVRTFFFSFC